MRTHCFDLYPSGVDVELNRIVSPVIEMDNEYSHIHQVNDVVLGAITTSMREMEHNFLPIIRDNFLKIGDDHSTIIDNGICIYPKRSSSPLIVQKITTLGSKFQRLLINVV